MDLINGNLIVAQSGGPTAVINSTLVGVIHEAFRHESITGVYGSLHGIEGILHEELIDFSREDPAVIEGLRRTPSAALGSCRHKLSEEDYKRIITLFEAHNIRYFFYIGGNDSMDTAHVVGTTTAARGYDCISIGLPKTIDNDLAFTDHCPGYGSVARWVASSVRNAGLDTEAIGNVDTVKIIEIMGRNAGWITASSALAREHDDAAPHLIYLPERPLDINSFISDVDGVVGRLGHCVIAVCEGVKGPDGKTISASTAAIDTDRFGHAQMGGVADLLCKVIGSKLKIKARFDKPGTIQRMGMEISSAVDLEEAYRVGQSGVQHAVAGVRDKMISLKRQPDEPYRCETGLVELAKVANAEKLIPDDFIADSGNDVTEKFLNYARPLIGGPLQPYSYLQKHLIEKKL